MTEYEIWKAELCGARLPLRLRINDLWRRMTGRETYGQVIRRRLGLGKGV